MRLHSIYTLVIKFTHWCGCLTNYMEHLIITKYSFRGCTATLVNLDNIPCMQLKAHTEIISTWCGIEWCIIAVRFSPQVCDTRWHNHNKYSTYHTASTPQTCFHSHSAHFHFTMSTQQSDTVKSGSTPVGGPVKSGRKRTKEKGRGLDKGLVRPELRPIGFNDKGVERWSLA